MTKSFNKDQLNNADLTTVCKQTFSLISDMDEQNAGVQVASAFMLATLVADHKGVDINDAMTVARNMIADGLTKDNIHVKALKAYAKANL
jgi:hypothetical protein